MSRTPKSNRIWNKQEKRIVRLLYRKGIMNVDVPELYWAALKKCNNKQYRNNGSSCNWPGYLDEVYYCTWDYWGECDEHPLIDSILTRLTSEGISDKVFEECGYEFYKAMQQSSFQYKGRKWFIRYLETLPTVRCDAKINKALKINNKQ